MGRFFFLLLGLALISFPVLGSGVFAQENMAGEGRLEGVVEKVLEEKEIGLGDKRQLYQKLELLVTKGQLRGQVLTLENGNFPLASLQKYQAGNEVVISMGKDLEGNLTFQITDQVRRAPLYWLFGGFIILALLVGGKRGLTALLGMGFSFFVIFIFVLPQISLGKDPVLVSVASALFIIPAIFYLSHGFNKKTTVAIVGTVIALIITGVLANIFVELARLSGFASEEAGFLQVAKQGLINIKGLLLAGIIIGVLGILDDVTISQVSVVEQLNKANERLRAGELYKRAMSVGKDHIASVVNTLVLVYTGAALPLLLLFTNTPQPFSEVVNYEIIATEIVRTLVGSIGLILAVPLVTLIAAFVFDRSASRLSGRG